MGNLEEDCIGSCVEIGGSRETSVCLQAVHEQRYWPNLEGVERYEFGKVVIRSFSPEEVCVFFSL